MDKQQNKNLRNANLAAIPENLKPHIYDLESRYGKYCYTPLAVPVIQDSKIVDWFFEHCKKIVKLKPDVADTEFGYSLFNSVNVCLDDAYRAKNPIWSDNDYPKFDLEFPHFYQQLMEYLPLTKIPRLSFWNSTRPIAPHRDHNCFIDLPNSFRVLIYDENPTDTLYVYEDSDQGPGPKVYIKRHSDTNSFVWNNLRVAHGSSYNDGYRKILLIINNFIPDHLRYIKCLEASISKYSMDALVSTKTIDAFI